MMTIRLEKPHKQNGKIRPRGSVIRIPYRLGLAMCAHGQAVQASHLTHGLKEAAKAEAAKKAAEKPKADKK